MHPPGPNLERAVAWTPPASDDRIAKRITLGIMFLPLVIAAGGNVLADLSGPAITVVVWVLFFVVRIKRGRQVYVAETFAILSCLVILQLLLDLHTRHLGDIVIAALHVPYFAAVLVDTLRDRIRCGRARRGDHEHL